MPESKPPLLALLLVTLIAAACGNPASTPGAATVEPSPGPETSEAAGLPLLAPGTHVGISYADPAPEAAEVLDRAFGETIEAGADAYKLSLAWATLEPSPGGVDTAFLEVSLKILASADLTPYLVIKTIDTVALALPSDLVDPTDPDRLADGRHFDDPAIQARFNALLDQVVPLLVEYGGFFVAVGNEIDPWLTAHPDEAHPFLEFVAASRAHVRSIEPKMGVGANMTYSGVMGGFPHAEAFLVVSDAASFSYYPLNDDFTPRSPDAVADDIAAMVELAGERPVLIQELGYPSGYLPAPHNNSSTELQRRFVENVFDAALAYPQVRFISFQHLADWQDNECDAFLDYYGSDAPLFREYLCSLGLRQATGEPKPAYAEFLAGLARLPERE
jgi:hypothetical protein